MKLRACSLTRAVVVTRTEEDHKLISKHFVCCIIKNICATRVESSFEQKFRGRAVVGNLFQTSSLHSNCGKCSHQRCQVSRSRIRIAISVSAIPLSTALRKYLSAQNWGSVQCCRVLSNLRSKSTRVIRFDALYLNKRTSNKSVKAFFFRYVI